MSFEARPTVLWREGMFLCPQHLQTLSREVTERVHAAESIGSAGDWGLLSLEVDEEALKRDVFRLVSADMVFRDGTLASFPSNATVAQREFTTMFTDASLDVYLGVPSIRPGTAALTSPEEGNDGARFVAQQGTVFDENVAAAERDVEFKIYQGRLFFGDEDRSGYESIHITRLVRKGKTEPYSALSDDFIAPVLSIGGSTVLVKELNEVADQLIAQSRDLAARIPQTAQLSSVEKGADVAAFVKLQAVNQCAPGLDQIRQLPELHPFPAFMQLLHAIGSLAIFSDQRTVPAYTAYDHDDLNGCFRSALDIVRRLIPSEVSVPYEYEDFKPHAVQQFLLCCDVPSEWAERERTYFIAVRADASADDIIAKTVRSIKLTCEADLDTTFQETTIRIPLEELRAVPLAFPKNDVHYFRIRTEGDARPHWLKILEAGQAFMVRTDPSLNDWSFSLYVEMR